MRGDLSAGLEEISWVLTATMVCTAIAMPTAGWLGMRFSQRRALIVCIVAFTLASAMLGFADTLEEVVFWRACQGLFGGPISPLCIPVILGTYPKRDHGMAMAFWAGGVMLAPIMGPPLGGYLTAIYDWHLTFVFHGAPRGCYLLFGSRGGSRLAKTHRSSGSIGWDFWRSQPQWQPPKS